MAKKKTAVALEPTKAQLEAICDKVLDRRANVYQVAKEVLGREVGEEIFDQLRATCEIFKCENCDKWRPVDEEGLTDWCNECLDAENNEDDDDDDDDDDE